MDFCINPRHSISLQFTAKGKAIHDKGLVSILQQIHDDLDAAVLEAYGWQDLKEAPHSCGAGGCVAIEKREALHNDVPSAPPQECGVSLKEAFEAELLTRLVALNHERAAEEKKGLIRYLRPDYQRGGDHRSPSPPEASIQADLTGTAILPQSPIELGQGADFRYSEPPGQ